VEGDGNLFTGGWRGELEFAFEILRVAALLHHKLEWRLRGHYEFALFHQLNEARVLDLLDLSKIISSEEKSSSYEGEGDGKEHKSAPVELWVLTSALPLAVVVRWLLVFV
jgi:hypothetical protein